MKITEKNRSLVFLGGTMLVGILSIGVLLLFDQCSDDVGSVEIVNEQVNSEYKTLERNITNLKKQNFNPTSYSTILTQIIDSYEQELLTVDQKTNLIQNLKKVYSDLVYMRCELYLSGRGIDGSKSVTSWLNQLQSITARNARIDNYRDQIKWYDYYSTTLPSTINNFINGGTIHFDEAKFIYYKNTLENMPNLESKYKNQQKFLIIKSQLIDKLNSLNNQFNQQELGL